MNKLILMQTGTSGQRDNGTKRSTGRSVIKVTGHRKPKLALSIEGLAEDHLVRAGCLASIFLFGSVR